MEKFDLENMSDDPVQVAKMRAAVKDIRDRLDNAAIDYRFMMQVFGEDLPLPTAEAVAIIAAQAFMKKLKQWDGEDFTIPLMFGVLITRGGFSYDNA